MNRFRNIVRKTLAVYGEDVIQSVAQHFSDKYTTEIEKISLSRVLSRINSQQSVDILWNFINSGSLTLRYEIIKALNKLRARDPQLKFGKKRIDSQIEKECENFRKNLTSLTIESNISQNVNPESKINGNAYSLQKSRKLLIRALRERLDHSLERIFRLLGLKYPARDIYNAYLSISSGRTHLKANAIEFLDNVLDPGLKNSIIPIVENYTLRAESHRMTPLVSHLDLSEPKLLSDILEADDNWLKIISLHLVPHLKNSHLIDQARELGEDPDERIKEAVQFAVRTLPSS
jgi:AAA family ATP:ADP antiporter